MDLWFEHYTTPDSYVRFLVELYTAVAKQHRATQDEEQAAQNPFLDLKEEIHRRILEINQRGSAETEPGTTSEETTTVRSAVLTRVRSASLNDKWRSPSHDDLATKAGSEEKPHHQPRLLVPA